MKNPEDHGFWESDLVFVFDPPIELPGGHVMARISMAEMVLGDGITKEDVVHALLNPVHVEEGPHAGT